MPSAGRTIPAGYFRGCRQIFGQSFVILSCKTGNVPPLIFQRALAEVWNRPIIARRYALPPFCISDLLRLTTTAETMAKPLYADPRSARTESCDFRTSCYLHDPQAVSWSNGERVRAWTIFRRWKERLSESLTHTWASWTRFKTAKEFKRRTKNLGIVGIKCWKLPRFELRRPFPCFMWRNNKRLAETLVLTSSRSRGRRPKGSMAPTLAWNTNPQAGLGRNPFFLERCVNNVISTASRSAGLGG